MFILYISKYYDDRFFAPDIYKAMKILEEGSLLGLLPSVILFFALTLSHRDRELPGLLPLRVGEGRGEGISPHYYE
ncbi:hypothetical protein ACVGWG_00665, partial [Enterobacter asburiae]